MYNELEKKVADFLCGKIVKINSSADIISIVSHLSGMFPNSFNIEQEISHSNSLVKKDITHIALGYLFGTYVIVFFYYDFYTRFRIREGNKRTAYAYVCNTHDPDCWGYESVSVINHKGDYYFTLF